MQSLFTIGYGGRSKEDFLALLKAHGVRTVVDIRLRPDRASMAIWVKAKTADKRLEQWLAQAGIGYRSLVELGNVFLEFPDWQERYRGLLDSSGELLAERLCGLEGPICLMCAEKRVCECQRQQVVEWLAEHKCGEVHRIEGGTAVPCARKGTVRARHRLSFEEEGSGNAGRAATGVSANKRSRLQAPGSDSSSHTSMASASHAPNFS